MDTDILMFSRSDCVFKSVILKYSVRVGLLIMCDSNMHGDRIRIKKNYIAVCQVISGPTPLPNPRLK
jgi:hypothetical protein